MAAKKTTGWSEALLGGMSFFRESLTGSIRGVFDILEEGVLSLFRRLLRSFGLFFFSVLATVFVLVGIAKFLNNFYGRPGLGEIIVGVVIGAGLLFAFMIDRRDNKV